MISSDDRRDEHMGSDQSERLAVQDLNLDYALALDERNGAAFCDLFTEDAIFVVYEPHSAEPLFGYTGRAELAGLMGHLDQWGPTLHVMTNHRVMLDGDCATGVVYGLAHHTTELDGRPHTLVMALRYEDEYRREGTRWRFAQRKITRLWNETRPLMNERAAF
jgi:ketosteroid isomerase-like protein